MFNIKMVLHIKFVRMFLMYFRTKFHTTVSRNSFFSDVCGVHGEREDGSGIDPCRPCCFMVIEFHFWHHNKFEVASLKKP